jgi:hypothetical protein
MSDPGGLRGVLFAKGEEDNPESLMAPLPMLREGRCREGRTDQDPAGVLQQEAHSHINFSLVVRNVYKRQHRCFS